MLKGKKILVTGGSGFIGTNLIIELAKQGAKVTNVGIGESPVKIKGVRVVEEDLTKTDFSFLDENYDYVVHLAALSNPRMCEDKEKAFEVNVDMTEKFFEKLYLQSKKGSLKKVVFMSSVLVYSKDNKLPVSETGKLDIEKNTYAKTKGIDEEICGKYIKKGLPIIVFRLSNIYGPYQAWQGDSNLVPHLMKSAIVDRKIELKSGSIIRDWIFAEDAVKAVAISLESDFVGTLNLGAGIGKSAKDVAEIVGKLTNADVVDLKKEENVLNIICDITKIRKVLKWEPKTSLEEGLKKTFEYYKKTIKK